MSSRDDLKKALDYMRKKDPNNDTFQKLDRYLRAHSTINSDKKPLGSIGLFDEWDNKVKSGNQNTRKNMVKNSQGEWESKGYAKTMEKRSKTMVPDLANYNKAQNNLKDKFGLPNFNGHLTHSEAQGLSKENKKPVEPFKDNRGTLQKFGDFFKNKDVDGDGQRDGLLGAIDRFVVPISKGATDFVIPGNTATMARNNENKYGEVQNPVIQAAQKDRGLETDVLNATGMIGASLVPYSKGYKFADFAVNKVPKLANISNPYLKKAVTGGLAGGIAEAGISATNELANPDAYNWKDHGIRTGIGVAGGAILDPAMHGIYNLIKRGAKGVKPSADEVLGLPEPQKQLPEPQLKLPGPNKLPSSFDTLTKAFQQPNGLKSPIPQLPDNLRLMMNKERLQQQGLNFGFNTKNAPKARHNLAPIERSMDPMNRSQSYWQQRYEDFAKEINNNYDMNKMTPEALEDLWSGFAKYDEPLKLEQVVDLAYPKGFEAPPKPKPTVPEPPLKEALRQDKKINELIKGLYPPKRSEPKLNDSASLEEMFRSLKEVAPTKKAEAPSFEPLQFKRSVEQNGLNQPNNIGQSLESLRNVKGKANPNLEAITPNVPKANEGVNEALSGIDFKKLKDINGMQGYTSDVFRNTRDVFGDQYPKIKKTLLDPFDKAKKENVDLQEEWLNKLQTEVVDKLGIKKGSKLSKLVQDYGEKTITLDELKAAAPEQWKKVVQADNWFRSAYDQLIDQVNATRLAIYPNSPDRLVPKRQDYYRHFRELNGLEGLRNIFDSPAGIDPQLVGTSDFTNPSSKFAGFMQKRGLGPYQSDAVGGFLNYLPSASYAIKIDPNISKFKQFSKALKDSTGETKNLNSYIEFLEDFTKDLSGKTNPFDRPLQKVFGRRVFKSLEWMNNRVKKNAVLGNVGSALSQIANVPNGIAFAKQHSLPGAKKTLQSILIKNEEMAHSGFIKERYGDNMYRKFNTKLIDQPEKFAGWLMSAADRIGTTFIWNSAYHKGLANKVADPIKYADDHTRNLVAGRGIGEVPILQKSKTFQLIAPFQLEVANLWKVQREFVKEKDFGALITLYLGAWMFNKGMEETRGSKVVFDPVDALHDAFTDEDIKGLGKVGRVAGEVLSNVPLGQTLANFYPEYGTKHLPSREQFFGDTDPNRFGSGLLVAKGVQDPLYKLALPFGGTQVQKTIKGFNALNEEAAYNPKETKLKFPVERNLENIGKGLMFGPNALDEAKEYYNNDGRPLSEKQTAIYKQLQVLGVEEDYYSRLMSLRNDGKPSTALQKQLNAVLDNKSMTDSQKEARIRALLK